MAKKDALRKLGILRSGAVAGTYTNAAERPTELQMDGVFDAERDLVGGDPTKKQSAPTDSPTPPSPTAKTNTLSVVGLVLAFFIPLIGLICSIIGLSQVKKRKEKGRGIAIAGIISSVIVGILQIITFIVFVVAVINSSSVELTTYRDNAVGYSIKYPKGWNIVPQTVEGTKGIIITKNIDDDTTGKVSGMVEVVYFAPPPNGYNKDVLQAISESIQKDNKGTVVAYEHRSLVNGLDTITLLTSYDGENGKIKAKTTILLKKDSAVYTVSTQAPEMNWDGYQDSFDEIHHTFSPN